MRGTPFVKDFLEVKKYDFEIHDLQFKLKEARDVADRNAQDKMAKKNAKKTPEDIFEDMMFSEKNIKKLNEVLIVEMKPLLVDTIENQIREMPELNKLIDLAEEGGLNVSDSDQDEEEELADNQSIPSVNSGEMRDGPVLVDLESEKLSSHKSRQQDNRTDDSLNTHNMTPQ